MPGGPSGVDAAAVAVIQPPANQATFTWNHDRLTTREDMLVNACLTTFFALVLTQRQVQRGGGQPTADDLNQAVRVTIEWAARTFPDLDVRLAE